MVWDGVKGKCWFFLGNILWGGSADDGDDEEEDDEEEDDDEKDEGYVLVAMLVVLFRIVTVLLRAQKVKPCQLQESYVVATCFLEIVSPYDPLCLGMMVAQEIRNSFLFQGFLFDAELQC